jgi:hypothetical protein
MSTDDCKRDPNDGFDITLVGNISGQLFESEANKLIISNHTDNSSQWTFSTAGVSQNYNFLDHHRFVPSAGTEIAKIDFSNSKIRVNKRNGQKLLTMQAQIKDQILNGSDVNGDQTVWEFDLNDAQAQINGGKWNAQPNNFDITFLPFYDNTPDQVKFFGGDSILVSFGDNYYDYTTEFASQPVQLKTSTSFANYDKNTAHIITADNGTQYHMFVGAIADAILQQKQLQPIDLVIDGSDPNDTEKNFVESFKLLLNQNILYKEVNQGEEAYQNLGLGFNHQILVRNDQQVPGRSDSTKAGALISGCTQIDDFNTNDGWKSNGKSYFDFDDGRKQKWQFFAATLDIISTYESNDVNKPSLAISGITIADAPKRGQGTVQANGGYNPIIKESTWNSNQPAGVTGDALRDFRLKKIANSISQGLPSDDIWDWGNGTFNSAVKLFDNRLIAWETASDGFESNSPNLYSEANFLLTNDDALKIGSRNQQYVSNTLHQGPAGSAIMAGNYGFTNGPVFDSTVDGLFVHRIINDVAQQDPLGGLIGFRTHFNENLVGQQGNGSGIFANNFNNIYVPQMGYDNQFNIQAKANVVTRLGMVPAMSQSTFTSIGARDFGDGLKGLSNQVYGTGQFNIRNLQVDALMEDQQQPFPFSVVVDDTQSSIGDTDPIYNATGGGKNFYSFARAGKTSTTNLWFSKAPADTSNGVTQFVDVYGINETNDINNGDMASMQTTINDPILDLRNIFNKVNLSINIETNCGFQNQLFLVKATVDTITGQRYLDNPNGGRIAFENTDYCRSLIRDNLISITTPERRFGGEGKNFNLTLAVNRDEASLYVPVLINPHGSLFTYGKETSYGHQNLRNNTSKLNTFYFEDIKGLGDSDFNDLICTFSVLD